MDVHGLLLKPVDAVVLTRGDLSMAVDTVVSAMPWSPTSMVCGFLPWTPNPGFGPFSLTTNELLNFANLMQGVRAGWPVRAASHVHLVVAELCCGTPCQLPAQRWELAGKTQRQSS